MQTTNIPEYPILLINSEDQLGPLLASLEKESEIFFDMEVDNMYHYSTRICLFQILTGGTCYLVDPLSDIDLSPMLNLFASRTLVLHGSDFDLRMLFQEHGLTPVRIFDTMIAAQLCGKREFGLAALVNEKYGISLNKKYQKADWSRRPLSQEMVYYAAQDTFFLPGLKESLTGFLKEHHRESWHSEWCDLLIKSACSPGKPVPEEPWRIKGSSRLEPRQLNVLKKIWKWRESTAKKRNSALFKVMNSQALLEAAGSIPSRPDRPVKLDTIPARTHSSLKSSFLKAIGNALEEPQSAWPEKIRHKRKKEPAPSQAILETIKEVRDRIADELQLPASLLANRDALVSTALTGVTSSKEMHKHGNLMAWQENLLFEPWKNAVANLNLKP